MERLWYMSGLKILVVDDNKKSVSSLKEFLKERAYEVVEASSGKEALEKASSLPGIEVLVLDLVMPGIDGFMLIDKIKELNPDTYLIVAGEDSQVPTVVEAIRRGASDFITKPYDEYLLLKKLDLIRKAKELEVKVSVLNEKLQKNYGFENIISCSRNMKKVFGKASLAAKSDAQIFLIGETGTGKGLLARAIHEQSDRRSKPFKPVNCGAIPKDLIEAELFGYRKGSFTGALSNHDGIFIAANKGTVFLDEIGEMSKELQVNLLTVLEENKVRPIGHTEETQVDVRIIAASNRTLKELKESSLREDLYYRLAVIVIEIPPLRERKEDIPLLLRHFIKIFNKKYSRNIEEVSDGVLNAFNEYQFPGNIRELENLIEGIIALSPPNKNIITEKDLKANSAFQNGGYSKTSRLSLKEIEKSRLKEAIKESQGNKSEAAKMLGISRHTLYRKLEEYGIE
jgi:DNA-binding NtrC family response regulator